MRTAVASTDPPGDRQGADDRGARGGRQRAAAAALDGRLVDPVVVIVNSSVASGR